MLSYGSFVDPFMEFLRVLCTFQFSLGFFRKYFFLFNNSYLISL